MRPSIYDLTKYPTTYDFAAWAVIARTHGVERVHFVIDGPIAHWKYPQDVAWKRFATVLLPLCNLARLSYSVGARIEGQEFGYHGGEVCRLYREAGRIEKLKPTVTWDKSGYVTITMRESFRNKHRDSNKEAWGKFRRYLESKNVDVMVIPECEDQPINLEHRMACCWGADMNMGVAQGPMALCVFSDAPYITLNQNPKDTTGQAQYDIDKLLVKTGFPPAANTTSGPRASSAWEPDTFENIVRAYEGMQEEEGRMKFIYLDGPYIQFMGRTFAFKKSTTVTDRATIEALRKRPDFMEVSDEPQKVEAPAAPAVLKRPVLSLREKRR